MELFAMLSANLIGGILCLILGLIIKTGKFNFLIAGFNTMSKEEQAKWNIVAISKFLGWLLIVTSSILLVACVPIALDFYATAFILISYGLFTLVMIIGAVYVNISPRFKNFKEE
jgi:succinate-acetate transporter protein